MSAFGLLHTYPARRALASAVAAASSVAVLFPAAPAGAQQRLATCVPSILDGSAQLAGTPLTVSPQPGALDATPATQISFVGAPASAFARMRVAGSHTGPHSGRIESYSQGDGASFVPSKPFTPGEVVTASGELHQGNSTVPFSFSFAVAIPDAIARTPESTHRGGAAGDVQSFVSRTDLHPPAIRVTTDTDRGATGENFLAPYGGAGQSGPMIVDAHGAMVWFRPLSLPDDSANLQVQHYRGRPVLTWWQGEINSHGFGWGDDVIDNAAYQQVARVRAGDGVQADLHEFQLTSAGTALISAYNPVRCDLSALGGPSAGAVTDSLFQEIDVATGLVRYQWSSLDHVGLNESYTPVGKTTARWPFDFFHLNSINVDRDGSLLISARDTWAAYDLDRRTGQIRWRLGGRRTSFALGAGVATAWQHDARELPDGDISLFDNGASPPVHQQSRGVVIHLDPALATASLVSQVSRPPPALLSPSQGNLQQLPSGDFLMGWGQLADFAVFSPAGVLVFDAHFPAAEQTYRALRFDWSATPVRPPTITVRSVGPGRAVYASWNGATSVASWRILAGSRPHVLRVVASRLRTGFETAIGVSSRAAYVVAQALDAAGRVLGTSSVAHA